MIDVGLVGETTVCGLAAHSLVPGTVEALQVGLSLVEGGEETDVVKHQDLKESGERESVCVCLHTETRYVLCDPSEKCF